MKPKTARIIGASLILASLAFLSIVGVSIFSRHQIIPTIVYENGHFVEKFDIFSGRFHPHGYLKIQQIRDGKVIAVRGPFRNLVVNAGETALRDCFGGTGTPTCTTVQAFKFHGIGTGATAAAEADTGCQTELTTQYNPDNTRATGSQTNNGANIYRTVGTNTVDASAAVTEFCLMSQAATGGGTMWTRIVFSAINLASGDSLQTTYDLTIE